MDKYTETKDLEVVAKALYGGLECMADGRLVCMVVGTLHWKQVESAIRSRPGRVFQIEVPRPDAGEGYRLLGPEEIAVLDDGVFCHGSWRHDTWLSKGALSGWPQSMRFWYRRKIGTKTQTSWPSCELTPELEALMRDTCEVIEKQGGSCTGIDCGSCAGSHEHNGGVHCFSNGWGVNIIPHRCCPVLLKNATQWLKDHHAKGPKFERVELSRNDDGYLVFVVEDPAHACHTVALSAKGFNGFEYAEFEGQLRGENILFTDDQGHLHRAASLEQIKAGQLWATYPVAFWRETNG